MTVHLTIEDAMFVIDSFGFHVRDIGLLGSALARPATTLAGVDAYPSFSTKAAALLQSMARNHALIDGNKRTAWTLMVVFLALNGYRHDFSTDAAFDLVVGIASGSIGLTESAESIAEHLIRSQHQQ